MNESSVPSKYGSKDIIPSKYNNNYDYPSKGVVKSKSIAYVLTTNEILKGDLL